MQSENPSRQIFQHETERQEPRILHLEPVVEDCETHGRSSLRAGSLTLSLGIVAVMVNPGWVQTEMGGPDAFLTPSDSVRGILQLVDNLKETDAGGCFDWNGEVHAW